MLRAPLAHFNLSRKSSDQRSMRPHDVHVSVAAVRFVQSRLKKANPSVELHAPLDESIRRAAPHRERAHWIDGTDEL
jgi:hypothetical protein